MWVASSFSGAGSWQQQSMDQALILPGQVSLTAAGSGPVVAVDLGRTLDVNAVMTFAVKTTQQCTATSGDYVLATVYSADGIPQWSLRLTWNGTTSSTDLDIYNERTPGYQQWLLGVGGDEQWRAISTYDDGLGHSIMFCNNANGLTYSHGSFWGGIRYVMLGGRTPTWQTLGKQTLCPSSMSVAGVAAASASNTDRIDHARPLATTAASTRLNELVVQYCGLTLSTTGSLIPLVTRTDSEGRSALECVAQVVGTVGATCWAEPSTNDQISVAYPDVARPTTVSATITLETDDDAATLPLTWRGPGEAKPTRVTVGSAFGSKTARNAFAEDVLHVRQEESWDSCAPSATVAGQLAGARLNRSATPRIAQLAVDLVSASTDLYAAVLALRPGSRITVAGLPSAKFGVTQLDAWVMGWTERWGENDSGPFASFVFDLAPTEPVEMVLDDATSSRLSWGEDASGTPLATVTSGTAVSTTANGTLVIATASGPTLTTDAAAYPLSLNYNGEKVTISSPPASSVSPQTVTTTARGVSPTVARVHATGEPIDVWRPGTMAEG